MYICMYVGLYFYISMYTCMHAFLYVCTCVRVCVISLKLYNLKQMMSVEDIRKRRASIGRRRSHYADELQLLYLNVNANTDTKDTSTKRGCLCGTSSEDSSETQPCCMKWRKKKKKGYHVRAGVYKDKVAGETVNINVSSLLFQVPKEDESDIVMRRNITPPKYELTREYYR